MQKYVELVGNDSEAASVMLRRMCDVVQNRCCRALNTAYD